MESNAKLDKKTMIKSAAFVTAFWSFTALMFYGLYELFDAIDISTIVNTILGA